jgi:hypothetical protein
MRLTSLPRMETPQDVRHAIRPGDWAPSIDLRDAYFHVPIHAAGRKFFRFGWRGRLFQFCVLPFGLFPGGFHDQVFACPRASPWGWGVVRPQDALWPLSLLFSLTLS